MGSRKESCPPITWTESAQTPVLTESSSSRQKALRPPGIERFQAVETSSSTWPSSNRERATFLTMVSDSRDVGVSVRQAIPDDVPVLRDIYRRSSLSNRDDRDPLLGSPSDLE